MSATRIFGTALQLELYGKESVEHFKRSKYIQKFLSQKAVKNANTAATYRSYLTAFANFVFVKHAGMEVDAFVDDLNPFLMN